MIIRLILTLYLFPICLVATAQRYSAEKGVISFFSKAPIENIQADNEKVTSLFNADNGSIAFSVLNKEFQFPKKLMQEHFNDKYMESHRFPRSTFSGKVTGYSMDAKGLQNVEAKGKLTIHGIVREIGAPGTLEIVGNNLLIISKFTVLMADYDIRIPQLLWKNIAEEVEVTVNLTYKIQ